MKNSFFNFVCAILLGLCVLSSLNYNSTGGPAQFTYWVSDGTVETRATMNLTVLAVNDLPVVTGETVAGTEDVGLLFTQAQLLEASNTNFLRIAA